MVILDILCCKVQKKTNKRFFKLKKEETVKKKGKKEEEMERKGKKLEEMGRNRKNKQKVTRKKQVQNPGRNRK